MVSLTRRVAPVVLALLLGGARWCLAQDASTVAGTISAQSGAALAGIRVTLLGAEVRTVDTDAQGGFEVRDLGAGEYALVAEAHGFQRIRQTFRVAAGQRLMLTIVMPVVLIDQASVTASKLRTSDPQRLPLSTSAVSSEELGRAGTISIDQAAPLAPSVNFTQTANFGQLSIRGIGTNAVYAGADPSSAMYLDGVYLARPAMTLVPLLDMDRIEVLRGPQGTLFGRNVVGGAVNLVSRVPSNDVEAVARVSAGTLDQLRVEARAAGPLRRDRVMGSLSLLRSTQDGYVRDLAQPARPMGGDDTLAARGQLRVIPHGRLDLLFSADTSQQDATPLAFNKVLAVKPGFIVDNPDGPREVRSSEPAMQRLRQYGGSARMTAALTPATTLVSLTAFRSLEYEFLLDNDITELDVTAFASDEAQRQLSQEIVVARRGARVDVVGGAFLFAERDHQPIRVDQFGPRTTIRIDPRVQATSRALFAQATIGLTDRLSATAGLRYTRERKDIDNGGGMYRLDDPGPAVPGTPYAYADGITHTAWTPKIGVDVKGPAGTLVYASATRGFKSGGFNLTSTQAGRGFAPEWAWSYEGGVKAAPLAGRTRFALAAFVVDYTNLQVQNPIQQGVIDIRNAAAATIRGVELEHATRWGRGIETGGHVSWLDARYDQYLAVNLGGVLGDVSGNRLNNAPEWGGRLWVAWSSTVRRAGRLSVVGDATAQSTTYFSPFNDEIQRQRPYGLLTGRVEYGPHHQRWSLAVYARNLTAAAYITGAFGNSPVAFGGRPGPPRQFAVELTVRR